MASPHRSLLLLALVTLLLTRSLSTAVNTDGDDDEDLSFLDDDDDNQEESVSHKPDQHSDADSDNDDEYDNYDDFEDQPDFDKHDEDDGDDAEKIDEKDVVVLTDGNFTDFVEENKYVMVEFYAPWCGHCQALAPEYAAAATEIAPDGVKLAKVDATVENDVAEQYEVQGFPTVLFFVDGAHKTYSGQRTKDAIVTWIKKKIGPGVSNITTTEEAESILTSEDKVVLGFLDSLVGSDSEELAAASKLQDDINFYQTVNPNVAKMFHFENDEKRPALVLLKKEAEKVSLFEGQFKRSAIADFVAANKLPLVTTFSRESAPLIFESSIKKQLLLFAQSNDSGKVVQTFQEAAKLFKGKLIFVHVEVDNEEVGKPVADYFGVTGDAPKVLGYAGNNDENKKYFLDGEITVEKLKAFGENFLEDKLKPFYKSDPIPENNGDVKIVVGDNFDDIVLDESKDVLLELYAPWCGHCQALEPMYNKLAKHLRGVDSIVVAKMDGTTNEHPRAKADGFPTILFFPAGHKSSDPIPVDTDRTVKAFYKFLKKHASIPFKLQKPDPSSPTQEDSVSSEQSIQSSTENVKDEL